ncbi:MAG: redoxin family protein, partial [Phycisphaerae bacterium]
MYVDPSGLVGEKISIDGLAWLNLPGDREPLLAGKVTLIRWWTDGCPYCATSLPAIERIRERFADRGLQTIAVYHPKPPRDVAAERVLQQAKNIGYDGWVASDLQWGTLTKLVPNIHSRRSTSMTFVV